MQLATLKDAVRAVLDGSTIRFSLDDLFFGNGFEEFCTAVVDQLSSRNAWPCVPGGDAVTTITAIIMAVLSVSADQSGKSHQNVENGLFYFPRNDNLAEDRLLAIAEDVWGAFQGANVDRNAVVALLQQALVTKAARRLANPYIPLPLIAKFATWYVATSTNSEPWTLKQAFDVLLALNAFVRDAGMVFAVSTEDLIIEIAHDVRPTLPAADACNFSDIRDAVLVRIVCGRIKEDTPSRADVAIADQILLQQVKHCVYDCFEWMRPLDEPPKVIGFPEVSLGNSRLLARQILDRLIHGTCKCARRGPSSSTPLTGNAAAKVNTCFRHHQLHEFQPANEPLIEFIQRAVQGSIGVFRPGSFESGMLSHQLRLCHGMSPDFQPVVMDDVLLRQCKCKTETAGKKCPQCVDGGTFFPGYRIVRLLVREDVFDWTRIEVWRCRKCDFAFDVDRCKVRGPGHANLLISDHDCCPRCGTRHGQRPFPVLALR